MQYCKSISNCSENSGPHKVHSDASSQDEAQVHVDGVVLVLDDARQAADDGTDDEGEHQERLQQLGRVRQRAVEVHLQEQRQQMEDIAQLASGSYQYAYESSFPTDAVNV